MQTIERDWVRHLLPHRAPETHKNDYGRVLAVCGCRGYTGAAYFAAQGAVRMGSGVVTLAVPEAIYPILAVKLNEPVVRPLPADETGKFSAAAADELLALAARADALLIGSGLGRSAALDALVMELLRTACCPMVVDADGINALAGHKDVLREAGGPCILTPHKGEFQRLSGVAPMEADAAAQHFAMETGCVLLLKGHRTLISAPDGRQMRNTTGNAGMAKGGSGDVLAGMLLSLLGQGLDAFDAACAGAWLHGAVGDRCAAERGEYGMTPTDMLEALPYVTAGLTR
ncbi:MAG: NAD(P)H-hydrate dehydratase [Butyricicoccus sp.]